MNIWQWLAVGLGAAALVAALWLLDRIGLWLEDGGLFYYRRKGPRGSALGNLVHVQQLLTAA
jgi:hypothetical protein